MKKTATALLMVVALVSLLSGCRSRSYLTESALVDMAKAYQELFATHDFEKVLPMLSGDQLSALSNALPVLTAASSAVQTELSGWKGVCDFMNKDKTRGSVTATYVQKQTVKDVGTLTEEFTTVYDFAQIAGDCTARMVGYAMAACPDDVPWQRVINAQGKVSPRADNYGTEVQRLRLLEEGVDFDADHKVDFAKVRWAGPDIAWLLEHGFTPPDATPMPPPDDLQAKLF